MTTVSLVFGTFPTRKAASRATVTPLVLLVCFASLKGASVSASLGSEVAGATPVGVACMV